MRSISLTQNKVALVDDKDYEWLSKFSWRAVRTKNGFYAATTIDGRDVKMHRLILDAPDGTEVDHVNNFTLDNSRKNLRECTHTENMQNQTPRRNTSSRYKGVYWNRNTSKYRVNIVVKGERKFLGSFDDEDKAGERYNQAAEVYFGQFAHLNNIVRAGETYRLFAK